jgi:hypothetical protein
LQQTGSLPQDFLSGVSRHRDEGGIRKLDIRVNVSDDDTIGRVLKDLMESIFAFLEFAFDLQTLADDKGEASNSHTEDQTDQDAG